MQILLLLLYSLLLYVFFTLLLLPLGQLISVRALPELKPRVQFLAAFGFSSMLYPLLLTCALVFGFSNTLLAYLLLGIILFSLVLWIIDKHVYFVLKKDIWPMLLIGFVYFTLTLVYSAFPLGDLRDISALTSKNLTLLQTDNLIPYNFSRYIVERIEPNSLDVLPRWKAGERGPLAALLNSVVFISLGLKENARWTKTTPGLFFLYQGLITYLNMLSLFAVWLISRHLFGLRAAYYSALLLSMSYFYFINVLFSWPKFFMAYFILASIFICMEMQKSGKHRFLVPGLFAGAGILSHDSAIFYVAAFMIVLACTCCGQMLIKLKNTLINTQAIPPVQQITSVFAFVFGVCIAISPWQLYKLFHLHPAARGIYFHLFCYLGDPQKLPPFAAVLEQYLSQTPLAELLSIRVANLLYPFYPLLPWHAWNNPLLFINLMQASVFFQLVLAVGLPIFLLSFWTLFKSFRDKQLQLLFPFLFVCIGALFLAAVSAGCQNATVNHVWAYPAILVAILFAAPAAASSNIFGTVLCALGVGSNIGLAAVYLLYHPIQKPFLHGSTLYLSTQAVLVLFTLMICLIGASRSKQ